MKAMKGFQKLAGMADPADGYGEDLQAAW